LGNPPPPGGEFGYKGPLRLGNSPPPGGKINTKSPYDRTPPQFWGYVFITEPLGLGNNPPPPKTWVFHPNIPVESSNFGLGKYNFDKTILES